MSKIWKFGNEDDNINVVKILVEIANAMEKDTDGEFKCSVSFFDSNTYSDSCRISYILSISDKHSTYSLLKLNFNYYTSKNNIEIQIAPAELINPNKISYVFWVKTEEELKSKLIEWIQCDEIANPISSMIHHLRAISKSKEEYAKLNTK
jgi:hypothetical protein